MDLIALGASKLSVHLKYQDDTPAANLRVSGLVDLENNTLSTNSSGYAEGYVKNPGSKTLNINYADATWSHTFSVELGNIYTINGTVQRYTTRSYTATTSITFSPNVKSIDFLAVGGGGGGSGCGNGYRHNNSGSDPRGTWLYTGNGGGGSGAVSNDNYAINPDTPYQLSIGAGGSGADKGVSKGKDGGNTTVFGRTSPGGKGGDSAYNSKTADGHGAYYFRSNDTNMWPSESIDAANGSGSYTKYGITVGGSGGGGGMLDTVWNWTIPAGTSPTGGSGGAPMSASSSYVSPGHDGRRGGGGGGGGLKLESGPTITVSGGGSGGDGYVYIQMNFD